MVFIIVSLWIAVFIGWAVLIALVHEDALSPRANLNMGFVLVLTMGALFMYWLLSLHDVAWLMVAFVVGGLAWLTVVWTRSFTKPASILKKPTRGQRRLSTILWLPSSIGVWLLGVLFGPTSLTLNLAAVLGAAYLLLIEGSNFLFHWRERVARRLGDG